MSSRRWRGERTWARRAFDYSSTYVHAPGQEAGGQPDRVARWEYRSRDLDRVASDWISEAESLDGFTPLQLDTSHALWDLYDPSSEQGRTAARDERGEETPRA